MASDKRPESDQDKGAGSSRASSLDTQGDDGVSAQQAEAKDLLAHPPNGDSPNGAAAPVGGGDSVDSDPDLARAKAASLGAVRTDQLARDENDHDLQTAIQRSLEPGSAAASEPAAAPSSVKSQKTGPDAEVEALLNDPPVDVTGLPPKSAETASVGKAGTGEAESGTSKSFKEAIRDGLGNAFKGIKATWGRTVFHNNVDTVFAVPGVAETFNCSRYHAGKVRWPGASACAAGGRNCEMASRRGLQR
jgi:hypothetical protein